MLIDVVGCRNVPARGDRRGGQRRARSRSSRASLARALDQVVGPDALRRAGAASPRVESRRSKRIARVEAHGFDRSSRPLGRTGPSHPPRAPVRCGTRRAVAGRRCTATLRYAAPIISASSSTSSRAKAASAAPRRALGTSRGNLYAGLRRIVHRLDLRDSGELLRLVARGESAVIDVPGVAPGWRASVVVGVQRRRRLAWRCSCSRAKRVTTWSPCTSTTGCEPAPARRRDRGGGGRAVRRRVRASCGRGRRRAEPRGAGARRAVRGARTRACAKRRGRDPRRSHSRRPGRDRAAQPAARQRNCGPGGHGPAARERSSDRCSGCAARRRASSACAFGLVPVHDPMNDELRHRRVWLRREIIPRLERGADRDLVEVLARQADVLRDDDALLDELAAGTRTRRRGCARARSRPRSRARVVRRWLGDRRRRPRRRSSACSQVARGERRAAELPRRRRVERVARPPGARPARRRRT